MCVCVCVCEFLFCKSNKQMFIVLFWLKLMHSNQVNCYRLGVWICWGKENYFCCSLTTVVVFSFFFYIVTIFIYMNSSLLARSTMEGILEIVDIILQCLMVCGVYTWVWVHYCEIGNKLCKFCHFLFRGKPWAKKNVVWTVYCSTYSKASWYGASFECENGNKTISLQWQPFYAV